MRFCGHCGAALSTFGESVDENPTIPGMIGGRYRAVRLLGEGSRKRVYLAVDERLAREVAVAVVKIGGLDTNGRSRITREAQAMARLGDDPGIVTVFDVGEDADGTPFIVSQYMAGGSLDQYIDAAPGRRFAVVDALRVAEQLALGLAHMHRLSIVHRDLKPGNIWLDVDGVAKLGDFGLAADLDASRMTAEGTVLGTVTYLAPEQALGREVDQRADLYALGAVLYEMLCGRPPFLGDDMVSVISQHLNTPPMALRVHNEGVPPSVETLVMRLLEKDPAARPQKAEEVLDALAQVQNELSSQLPAATTGSAMGEPLPTGAGVARLGNWGQFVGRVAELGQLRAMVDDALSGRTRIVMVVGEPGIGKTRTVEELDTYAALRGAQVLWGHSYEGEVGVPFLPFVEALRTFVRGLSGSGDLIEPAAGGTEVATIVPELRDLDPQIPHLPPLEAEAERLRLFGGVASFLQAATRLRPLVIVLDDLHWSDKPTLLLLVHLARHLRHARLAIVGTYRDIELDRAHPLSDTIAILRREHLYERVLLRGLPSHDVRSFIEAVGGQEPPAEFADLIFRETEGNPFFVAEILRHLAETGAIRHEGDRWVGTPESVAENLPEGVREVIGRRLDGLSAECNAALVVAAAMPGGFTVDVVGAVAELDEDTMLDVLDEALGARVIRERRERPGTYEFSHALIRQTLYGELSTPRRVRMHRRVGEALERRFADSIETHLPELAYHAYEAAPGGDVAKAVNYARLAGDRAAAQAAFEEAERTYKMALQASELAPAPDPATRADLLLALALASDGAGDATTREEACVEAARLARDLGDVTLLARAAIEYAGTYWYSTEEFDARRFELYREAEDALRDGDSSRELDLLLAQVLTAHAAMAALRDPPEYRRTMTEAVALAREADDPKVLARALLVSGYSRSVVRAEHDGLLREVVEQAERSGDISLSYSARGRLLTSAMFGQRRDEVDDHLAALRAEADRSRAATYLVTVLQVEGAVAAIDGRYEDSERLFLQSAETARSLGLRQLLPGVGVGLFPVYREWGRLAEFEGPTRRTVAHAPDIPAWRAGLAQLLSESGRREEAGRIVEDMVASGDLEDLDQLADTLLRPYTLAQLTEVAAAAGLTGPLKRLDEWLRGEAKTQGDGCAAVLSLVAYHGSFARYLGLAASGLGRHDEAVEYQEQALGEHQRMRAPGWAARSRYDLARALHSRGGPGDAARAASLLTESTEQATRLGMSSLLKQTIATKLALQGVDAATPITGSIHILSNKVATERPELGGYADADGRVTICFSDIVGYTAMTDQLGDHRTHEILRNHNALLRAALDANAGVEVKSEGDGFMLSFTRTGDALAFAAEFQRALTVHEWPDEVGQLKARMGIHRGEVIRDADDFYGRTVIVGARVASAAAGGEVLVTEDVLRAAKSGFRFGTKRNISLKGLSGTWPVAPLEWSLPIPGWQPEAVVEG
jgi:class 3 adenylate cyclase/tetratricopeptide (TPR) repeat protein